MISSIDLDDPEPLSPSHESDFEDNYDKEPY